MTPTFHKPIPLGSRVRFDITFGQGNTKKYVVGSVEGIASYHVIFTYIILLDEPFQLPEGLAKCVTVNGPQLESEDGSMNWLNT